MMSSDFQLHPQLHEDCLNLGRFALCHLLLHRDANYPWFILVPDRIEVTEIYQLCQQDQNQLMQESTLLSKALVDAFAPDKLNVAALGNVVPQLHIHHIVRYKKDAAWPAPIWGHSPAKSYDDEALKAMVARFMRAMDTNEFVSID